MYPRYREVAARTVHELCLHPSKFAARSMIQIPFAEEHLVCYTPDFETEYRYQNKGIWAAVFAVRGCWGCSVSLTTLDDETSLAVVR